jgi:hypothetical protein
VTGRYQMAEIIDFETYKEKIHEEQPSDDMILDPIDEIIHQIDDGLWDL